MDSEEEAVGTHLLTLATSWALSCRYVCEEDKTITCSTARNLAICIAILTSAGSPLAQRRHDQWIVLTGGPDFTADQLRSARVVIVP